MNASTLNHVIFMLADDWGSYDASFRIRQLGRTPDLFTPNMDALVASPDSLVFDNYYVQPICTPTRSQLMSGRYQIHTGLQHGVINPTRPMGLPTDIPIIANVLKDLGYRTHLVGKVK